MPRRFITRIVVLLIALTAHGTFAYAARASASPRRPNIVIILADDLGYSDLGCYGGEIKTPNLDALAANGLRFTQFYNNGRCCPTRASLLTGLYPHEAGVGRMTADAGLAGYRGTLTAGTVTIAEALAAAGYRTGMAGKWHLSLTPQPQGHMRNLNNQAVREAFSDVATYPTGRGFEDYYGVIWGVVNYFDPFSLVSGREAVREVPEDYYITDAITDHAVEFIESHANGPDPFFLYIAHVAPHWPLHAREQDIARYAETYTAGWDVVREARHRRIIESGLFPKDLKLPPREKPDEAWADNPHKAFDARAMAVHAAMVDRMDQGIGRVVAKLREKNLLDDTLILFLSDNGASPEVIGDSGFDRPSETRNGRRIVYPTDKQTLPGPEATFAMIGPQWANVANTPFRLWKAEMYEGGIATPLIVHWPRGMTAPRGGHTAQVGHVIDLMATCLDVAGAEYPAKLNGSPTTPIAGKSLLPVFRGERRPGHDLLAWEHFGAKAVRRGDWKLVARPNGPWALHDLSKDRTELTDLAAAHPEVVRDMEASWQQWATANHVLPAPSR